MAHLPRWRRIVALTAVSATVLTSVALATLPAEADTAPATGTPSTVSADSLPAPQTNGVVWAQVVIGNTVYVGGNFTQAQPSGAAAGVGSVGRAGMLAYNLTTGALLTGFAPTFNAQVRGLAASPDGSTVYAVGDFTTVSGTTHSRIVALDAGSGAVRPGFTASANASVIAVATSGSAVYFGGAFTSVNGTARTRAAAVSGTSGAVTGFAPVVPDYSVHALVVSPDGSKVVLGGSFTSLNGSTNPGRGLGAVDSATGVRNQTWGVGKVIYDHGANSAIWSLSSDGTNVYGTGYVYGGQSDGNLEGSFNATWADGSINWIEDCHGDTYSVAALGDTVYTVSHAHYCGNLPNGFPQTDPNPSNALKQHALAFSKAATGTLAHDPYGPPYVDMYGQPAPTLLSWYPTLGLGSFTGQSQAAWNVVTSASGYVLLGGEFPTVNGQRQVGLARFAVKTIAPNKQGPQLSSAGWTPTAVSFATGSVRVSWPANWDRDNANLTYSVSRAGKVVYTTTAESEGFWLRPTLGFTDTGLSPGASATYTVTATDPFGNSATSAPVTATVSAISASSVYAKAVIADGATDYWRLGEAAGPTVYDSVGYSDMTAGSGVTFGTAGALASDTSTAATFSGAATGAGLASTRVAVPGPNTFSIETWFKTTSSAGGKIVGFGNASTGSSTSYDRHVYMDGTGTVFFGVYNGSTSTVQSGPGYNDGKWHAVVASLSSAGMQLSLDGENVASRTDVTTAQAYSGYWRIGGDSSWAGASYFAGSVDDTAIYSKALAASTVQAHYVDATSATTTPPTDAPPVAAYTANPSNLKASFDASGSKDSDGSVVSYAWDFGDGSAVEHDTVATTSHTYDKAGTYAVGLTVTDDKGITNTVTKQLTVSAANQAPTAAFSGAASGLGVALDASASKDPDGTIASYAWSFGDGTAPETDPTSQTAHSYAAAGSYTVSLTVTDDQGARATVTHSVTVGAPDQAPVASFTASASDLKATVDGTGSSDPDGSVASYAWSFGDGGTATGATAGHTYAAGGTFTIALTVTDDGGASASTTRSVTVAAASASTLASDAFNRSVSGGLGSAASGGSWAVSGTASDFSVAPGAAQFGTAAGSTRSAYLGDVASTSSDVSVTVSLPSLPVGGTSYTGVVGRHVGADDYNARILVAAGGAVTIQVMHGTTALKSATVTGLTYVAGLPLRLRMQTVGTSPTTVQARVWKASGAEPTGWQVAATDSTAGLQAAGSVGLRSYLGGGVTSGKTAFSFSAFAAQTVGTSTTAPPAPPALPANVAPTASFTATTSGLSAAVDASASSDSDGTVASYAWDFGDGASGTGRTATHVYAAGGTYTVALTATDDQGAKDSTTRQVTVSAPASPTQTHLAADAFGRTVTGGLGAADTGGTWTIGSLTASYSVASASAAFKTAAGSTMSAYLSSVGSSASDVAVSVVVPALPIGGTLYAGVVGRRVGSDDYNARILISATGAVSVQVLHAGTALKSATVTGLTATAGSTIHLRMQTTGTGTTTLQARAWADGVQQPSTWQVSATDTTAGLQAAGSVGLRTYLGAGVTNGPSVVRVDDFVADPVN